jgi:2-aminoadipate transaminase
MMQSARHHDVQVFQLAERTGRMNASVIREILKITEQPGVLSLAGGLPSAASFPVAEVREACAQVLRDEPHAALQYAASEGHLPLREWVAADLAAQGVECSPAQVLVTHGSQQALDLVGKVLVDDGAPVAVEAPSYLGALQAFTPYGPRFLPLEGDEGGPLPEALLQAGAKGRAASDRARFAYLLPSFQNPTGVCFSQQRREALMQAAREAKLPVVEDNPYGELWLDAPPPRPLASHWPEGTVLLGSFSKTLAPGLRLGYVVAPTPVYAKLLQAKQASDLHTSGFAQRVVHAVLQSGGGTGPSFLQRHLPAVRERYRAQRDAMQAALTRHLGKGFEWARPQGGMFFWVTAPAGVDTLACLPQAVQAGVAYVPGSA